MKHGRADAMVVDNFAGGGGASLGIEQAIGRPVDVAINHDRDAIAMHVANHPDTRHYQEDIWQVDPLEVTQGREVALAWFSPDCTHFSKAKGAKPRSKEIRGLAWVVIDWARKVSPAVIMLENVEEFSTWGPLDDQGMPIRERRGETFEEWRGALEALGYVVDFRELRASDYGAPTIRKRLFMVARRDGLPISWPAPTHGKDGFAFLPYRTAAECIDWSIACPSIFERRKPLAEATLRRIAAGIRRYVIEAERPFIVSLTHQGSDNRSYGVNQPFSTVTGAHRGEQAIVVPTLIQTGWGEREGQAPRVPGLEKPLGTLMAGGVKHALVTPYLTGVGGRAGQSAPRSVDAPYHTTTAKADTVLVAPAIVRMNHDGQGKPADSVEAPLRTITTQHNKHELVTAFLAQHNGGMVGKQPDVPMSTVTGRGSQTQLVSSHLVKLYGSARAGVPLDEPAPTVTAAGTHIGEVRAFLMHYFSGGGQHQDARAPLHTITSKDRVGLVLVHGEPYQIVDIGMRMLTPRELFRAQGFPEGYVIDPVVDGHAMTKTAQIRLCGNSVCPPAARAIVAANIAPLGQQRLWAGYEMAEAAS